MVKERYVSREVAKLLKDKGFDIPVNYEYHYLITVPQFHRKNMILMVLSIVIVHQNGTPLQLKQWHVIG